jgi:hypothetical protein
METATRLGMPDQDSRTAEGDGLAAAGRGYEFGTFGYELRPLRGRAPGLGRVMVSGTMPRLIRSGTRYPQEAVRD